ncbi:MAG: hypothetical protein LUG15_08170 [Oscillospiraceae bacterium]|nr:hypothetical protein [Oscillospiraceae bacterium]
MAIPPKKRITNARYNAKCDPIQIRPLKADGAQVRAAAAAAGQSLQAYIMQACRERMARDQQQADGTPTPPQDTTD